MDKQIKYDIHLQCCLNYMVNKVDYQNQFNDYNKSILIDKNEFFKYFISKFT